MEWFALIILLFMSAFFSATETALMSLSTIKVHHLVKKEIHNASLLLKMIANPSQLLSTILVGNNMVNIAASALATSMALRLFGQAGIGIAIGVLTVVILIFAEITPKTYAAANNEKLALKIVRIVRGIQIILYPVIKLLGIITGLLINIVGGKETNAVVVTEDEIRTMVDLGKRQGAIESAEEEMITSVFELNDTLVRDIMVHRVDIVGISVDNSLRQAWHVIQETNHSRVPVYKGSMDNIIGVLYAKDLLKCHSSIDSESIRNIMRAPYFIPVTKRISELLIEMRSDKIHIAIVLDEYGGTAGLAFLEDMVEMIVGTIGDEYDDNKPLVEEIDKGEFIVSSRAKVAQINQLTNLDLPQKKHETMGSLVFRLLGYVPGQGDTIDLSKATIVINEVDRNRIKRIRIKLKEPEESIS
ncbi:MAG: hemolysin family protein [Bacillota bacterium]|nr:hemolysin family protein [Bacillota bacterium]